MDSILSLLGSAFLVLGIVGDAMNKVLGLESTNWILMAVGFFVLSGYAWRRGYYSALHGSEENTQ